MGCSAKGVDQGWRAKQRRFARALSSNTVPVQLHLACHALHYCLRPQRVRVERVTLTDGGASSRYATLVMLCVAGVSTTLSPLSLTPLGHWSKSGGPFSCRGASRRPTSKARAVHKPAKRASRRPQDDRSLTSPRSSEAIARSDVVSVGRGRLSRWCPRASGTLP